MNKEKTINKTWLAGLIGYIVFFLKMIFPDLEVPDEFVDQLADFILLGIMLVPMFVNMFKPKEPTHPFEGGVRDEFEEYQDSIGDHGPMV